jgi:hypothetical protein
LELTLIQDTILEKGALMPWFLLSDETAIPLSAAAGRLAGDLPADFLREWDEYGGLKLKDSTTTPPTYTDLDKNDFDLSISKFGSTTAALVPEEYTLVGSKVAVFPLLSVDVTAALIYFKSQPALTADVQTNNWTKYASDVLIAELGIRMCSGMYMNNPAAAQQFSADRTAAYARMQTEDVARKNAARESFRGD